MLLVQIGAVKVDAQSFAVLAEFEIVVRPRINPVLSDYLVALTGVTNDTLAERGVDFMEAYERFVAFAAGGPTCAFGRDELVFEERADLR